MNVARSPGALAPGSRAAAIGVFDGVHRGHRRLVEAAIAAAETGGLRPTVVTFASDAPGSGGDEPARITTLERRLELLAELGVADALVVPFDAELASLAPVAFAERLLRAIGVETVAVGERFRFGFEGGGDPALLERLGFRTTIVPAVEGVSSEAIRGAVEAGEI
nr:FAD synthetase family protein [Actinomycetota bacterium]